MAENDLDGLGRRLSAPRSQQPNAKELLAELVRLVESSGPALEPSQPPARTVSQPTRTDADSTQRSKMTSLRSSPEAPPRKPNESGTVYVGPPQAPQSGASHSSDPNGAVLAPGRRGTWAFQVSALVLVGALVLGSIFWLKRVDPGLPNAPASIATTESLTPTPPRSNLAAAAIPSEAGATVGGAPQPGQGKGASPEDRPIDLKAVSINNPPHSDLAPTAIDAAQPTADASTAKPLVASVNASAAAAPIVAPQPVASQSLDPVPVPAVSLPPERTQNAAPTASTVEAGAAATHAPLPPIRPAPKPAIEAAGVAQQSKSRLDLPTKLSSKPDARVVVAKADAAGAKAPAERSEPPRREASVKPEKEAKTLKAAPAPTEAQAAPSHPPAAAQQANPNPVVHAFRNMVGALTSLIPFVPH